MWASIIRQDSPETVVWRPEATSVRAWREATIFLGSISTTFQIQIKSQRSEGLRGDVAIDQLDFEDCALPCESPKIFLSSAAFLWSLACAEVIIGVKHRT